MFFSRETADQLWGEYNAISNKQRTLLGLYFERVFEVDRASEYANHGFSRRIYTLVRCIESIFSIAYPEREQLFTHDERKDLEINLQAFVFNVFGCLDNLAWVWVLEKNILNHDGSALSNHSIGIRRTNRIVRQSFSEEFREYLDTLEQWFQHLDGFRHALAHRIPLYVPPYVVITENREEYEVFELRKKEAWQNRQLDEFERLDEQQNYLKTYQPIMTHSLAEEAPNVIFNAQIIADFNTIDDLGRKLIEELNR